VGPSEGGGAGVLAVAGAEDRGFSLTGRVSYESEANDCTRVLERDMKRRAIGGLAVVGFGLWLVGLLGAAQIREKGVTGTWEFAVEPRPDDGRLGTLRLKQDGAKVTGTVTLPGGKATEIKDGKFAAGRLTFFVQPGPNTPKIHHNGKLNGDTMKGKIEFEYNGEKRPGRDWDARRLVE
jgi:hypothetical protein